MITDSKEIEIISKAAQANVRDPRRNRDPFFRILGDFLGAETFTGATFLDLGPGQFDFGVVAGELGAEVIAVDSDPAVVELGRHRGHEVYQHDLRDLCHAGIDRQFDGIFCKYSWNSLWFVGREWKLFETFDYLAGLLKPGGWMWMAPWNGIEASAREVAVAKCLEAEDRAFVELGAFRIDLSETQTINYGIHGKTRNQVIFTMGLRLPSHLAITDRTAPDLEAQHGSPTKPPSRPAQKSKDERRLSAAEKLARSCRKRLATVSRWIKGSDQDG